MKKYLFRVQDTAGTVLGHDQGKMFARELHVCVRFMVRQPREHGTQRVVTVEQPDDSEGRGKPRSSLHFALEFPQTKLTTPRSADPVGTRER